MYKLFFSEWFWEEWKNDIKIFSIIKKMKKLYCVIYGKYRKLLLFTISSKCNNKDEKLFKEKDIN